MTEKIHITSESLLENRKRSEVVVKRVVEETGVPGLYDALVNIPNTDFQSLASGFY